MRLKINFTKNTEVMDNNLSNVTKYLFRCINPEKYHTDKYNDYSISSMLGGVVTDGGKNINYPDGGYIYFSSMDSDIINEFLNGVIENPNFGNGMKYESFEIVQQKYYNGVNLFKTSETGLLLYEQEYNKERKFYKYDDKDFLEYLNTKTKNRLEKINSKLDLTNFKIEMVNDKTRRFRRFFYKNRPSFSNKVKLVVHSDKKTAETLYNYGIGGSTGIGFGCLIGHDEKN